MLLLLVWIMIVSFHSGSSEDLVKQFKDEVMGSEGDTVTLSCNYSGSVERLYWYQQKSSSSPQFLIADYSENTPGLSLQHDKKTKEFHLNISSAAVTDSAVYYCALQPDDGTRKLIFGRGTELKIQNKEDYEPSYYKLTNENTMSCLATGFSRHNALSSNSLNWSEVVRISGDSLYNSVVLFPHGDNGEKCPENNDEPLVCVEQLKKGPTVNTVSLIVLGLRLLFIKTVIFNVLMTLRLWISQ